MATEEELLAQGRHEQQIKIGALTIPVTVDSTATGTACRVWEGGIALGRHLYAAYPSDWWRGRRILELGAGTALPSICCAALGASVTVTDQRSAIDAVGNNVRRAGKALGLKSVPVVRELDWGDCQAAKALGAPFDVVIGELLFR